MWSHCFMTSWSLAGPSSGRERAREHLDARAEGERAAAERVLEVAAAEDAAREPRHLLAVEGVDARGQPDLRLEGRIGALHGAVGGGAGVEHLVPAAAMVVAPGRRALLGVDRALGGLAADLLRGPLHALGEHVPEALARGDHLEQPVRALDIPPVEPEADLLVREISL